MRLYRERKKNATETDIWNSKENKPACRAESDGLHISISDTASDASSVSSGEKAALQSADGSCEVGRESDESRDRVVRKMRLQLEDHVLRIEF